MLYQSWCCIKNSERNFGIEEESNLSLRVALINDEIISCFTVQRKIRLLSYSQELIMAQVSPQSNGIVISFKTFINFKTSTNLSILMRCRYSGIAGFWEHLQHVSIKEYATSQLKIYQVLVHPFREWTGQLNKGK